MGANFISVQLDEMESMLQVSAAAIRGYSNSLQAVNRLPPEVLAMIFKEIQQHLPSFVPLPDDENSFNNQHKDWLVTTHVCRHWRGIVAACPRLWSTIDSHLIPRTFLKRSGNGPLTLYLGVREPGITQSLIEALVPQSHRFQEFHVAVDVWDGATPVYSLLNHPAPHLSSMTIINSGRDGVDSLPPVFAGHMPNLRQLTLEFFTSWPTGYFEQLTHLCLYHQCLISRPTTSQFLDYLDSCPQLIDLVLVAAGPTRDEATDFPAPPATRSVTLRHLCGLHLGEWTDGQLIARLLSHLTLPVTSTLHIWGHSLRTFEDLGSLFPADLSHLDNINTVTKWSLSRREMNDPFIPAVVVANSKLDVEGPFTLSQIIGLPLLDEIQALDIRESPTLSEHLSSDSWKDLFQKLTSMVSLEIYVEFFCCSSPTSNILSALDPRKDENQDSSGGVVCRGLEKLYINDDPYLPSLYITALAEERAKRGSPLKALILSEIQRDQDVGGCIPTDNRLREDWGPENLRRTYTARDVSALKKCLQDVEVTFDASPIFGPRYYPGWPSRFAAWNLQIRGRSLP